jgi:S-formylglutathione hydrolase FrmB
MPMTRKKVQITAIGLFIALSLAASAQTVGDRRNGTAEQISVPAVALTGNKLGDPTEQPAIVYLPASYAEQPSQKYPVLYVLHGFSLHSILEDWKEVITRSMDDFVRKNPDQAFIVVIPNGANKVDGSFYVDSAVGGNWEQYISSDLIRYIDSHYRTIANRYSRAVVGHSMGGFGALRMLLLHSDVFGIGYAMSPCCLDLRADMTSDNPAWLQVLKMHSVADIQASSSQDAFWPTALAAFAIAVSPNPKSGLGADLPYREEGGRLVEAANVVRQWKGAMPLNLIPEHESDLKRAAGMAIDYGYEDEFTHIPITSREFGEKLLELHIPVVVEGYHGDHNNGVPARIGSRVLPFIADHLQFQK